MLECNYFAMQLKLVLPYMYRYSKNCCFCHMLTHPLWKRETSLSFLLQMSK